MTTKVTISNDSAKDGPDQHIVLVKRNGQVEHKVYPGESARQVYVWANSPLTIEEAPLE